jgi:very-short-patch-repair endonuclease
MSEQHNQLTAHMDLHIRVLRQDGRAYLPEPEKEYRFHPVRKWRFDYAWPGSTMIAIEVDGGQWVNGRHQRGKGYEADCEKLNEATRLGWRVFRFTGDMVTDGRALATLESVFPPF